MRRGDIVIVVMSGDFGKARPCVIVQSDRYRDDFASVLMCPFSTAVEATHIARIHVAPYSSNGLQASSVVMTDKTTPVRLDRIRDKIGVLDWATMNRVETALGLLLNLDREEL